MTEHHGSVDLTSGASGAPSPELYRALFHLSPEGRSLTRAGDGHYVEINAALLAMLGYTREEVIGRAPLELGVWPIAAERDALVKLCTEQGAATGFRATLKRRDGSTFGGLVNAALVEIAGERYFLSSVTAV